MSEIKYGSVLFNLKQAIKEKSMRSNSKRNLVMERAAKVLPDIPEGASVYDYLQCAVTEITRLRSRKSREVDIVKTYVGWMNEELMDNAS